MTPPTTVRYRPVGGPPRRHRYRPAAGTEGVEYWRLEQEWTGCTWRTVGREPVESFAVND